MSSAVESCAGRDAPKEFERNCIAKGVTEDAVCEYAWFNKTFRVDVRELRNVTIAPAKRLCLGSAHAMLPLGRLNSGSATMRRCKIACEQKNKIVSTTIRSLVLKNMHTMPFGRTQSLGRQHCTSAVIDKMDRNKHKLPS
eukprot:6206353-Pleurochrysis_carterae.AAC.1